MAELARLHGSGTLAQIEHLALTEAVPANFLAQILGKLRTHGLITSRRGNLGGYILARPPEDITLYDIVTEHGRMMRASEVSDLRERINLADRIEMEWKK